MTKMAQQGKKKKERWPVAKQDALLELWEEHIGSLRGVRKNSHVYQEIAADMVSANLAVTAEEVKIRIKNYTAKYRLERKKIGPSGGSPSSWDLYDRVHRIIGGFPIHSHHTEDSFEDIEMLEGDDDQAETSLPEPLESSESSCMEPSMSSGSTIPASSGSSSEQSERAGSPAAAKRKKNGEKSQYELLKRLDAIQSSIDDQFEYCKHQDEKLLELDKRRTEMLEKFVSHTAELKDALIRHLSYQ